MSDRGTLGLVSAPREPRPGPDGGGAERRDDGEILARIAEGRSEAFAELYERYFHELYDFAARITRDRAAAADVVQNVFATVWERARRGEQVRHPRAWLYRVAHNAAVDELRRRKWTSGAEGDQGFDFTAVVDVGSEGPDRVVMEKELAELVWSTAATLTPDEYALLDLYVRRELAPAELADQFGISTGAVYTRLSRLRRSFEEALTATLLLRRGGQDCRELELLVSKLGAGAETPEGREVVRAHIRRCPTCQQARHRYLTAAEMLASLAPVALMPGVQDAIWSGLTALLGLGAAAGTATVGSSAHAGGAAQAAHPHPSLLTRAGSHPIAAAAGGLTLAVLAGLGVWAARDAFQGSPAPPSAARDPSRVWSPSHAVGKRSTESRVTIRWSRNPYAVSYSVLWSHAPRTEPDAVADLRGSATGTTSPKLAPGRWYFHLRTKGRDGTWTHTVHLGPFLVAPPSAPPHSRSQAEPGGTAAPATGTGTSAAQPSSGGSAPVAAPAGATTTTTRGSEGGSSPPAGGTPAARDTTPPSGQSVQLSGGPYYRTLAVPLVIRRGSDRGSGIDPATGVVERSSAALSDGSCGDWSAWSAVTLHSSTDTTVVDGRCYRYRYRVADRAGNRSAFSRPSGTASVDTSPPSPPALSLSESGPDTLASGPTIVYRPAGAGGTFVVAASSGDAGSGLSAVEFPGLANGMAPTAATRRTEPPYELAYTWTSGAAEAGAKVVTAYDRAGNSASATFTVTIDGTGPEGASAVIPGGPWFGNEVPVTIGLGTDAISGVDAASARVERDSSPLSAAGCASFGGVWNTVSLSGGADTSVEPGTCYRYRVSVADHVGNRATSAPSGPAKIDGTPPSAPALTLSESSPGVYVSGATLFYGPALGGSFTVAAASADPESGIAQVAFPALAGALGGGIDETAPYETSYSWPGILAAEGAYQVTASNGAGLTAQSAFTLVADTAGPTGMSVRLLAGPTYPGHSVPMKIEEGSDAGSGLDLESLRVERDSAPLVAGFCGLYSGTWTTVVLHGAADTSVVSGNCYRYRVSVADNVGNRATSPPSEDAQVT